MKPVFDVNGLATEPGEIRCYYYDAVTSEYMGWSDEFINIGVSMPGCSTAIEPGAEAGGKVFIFSGSEWVLKEDHRGETAYTTSNGKPVTIEYIGPLREGFTFEAPTTKFDKWDGNKWVADPEAQRAYDISVAATKLQALISQANDFMNGKQWPGKAAMGRLKDAEKEQYNAWLDYLDALEGVDTASAPDIEWPTPPEVQAR
ncbi:tail fiber assembly protein [Escherichia coli]|jgi:hypothetical protein|uniref:Tail fiber assembly protein n=3 Tax=root TaxID=1 RepID=K7PMC4_9CAUD|nr:MULTISPECIES: tail fiber assembly protein [Enterobacteriaceae]YP_007111526.1 tail fiber assembly [Enterobacteria phage mEp043 c-1]YP_007112366.1 tail fiber assembly [Enterobacteria phage mEp213]EEW1780755.1 tail fiber assembly protein [Escherichia coli]AFM76363.1 tail fiber assembly protein [Enterobacteria phage mEp213]AFM76437.1 tail fiber assembly protein [Enterobacteria phage mEp043 c-1]EEW9263153.1 tail fiber assembly protein [Escherichia coli]EFC6602700.1 tail fiber assembly protein 